MVTDRYDRGFEKLKEIDGEAGERVIQNLKDISPDFASYLIVNPDVKTKELKAVGYGLNL
jgi:4-carboxymuconolactone decarboxylase